MKEKGIKKTDKEWLDHLGEERFRILREAGTEAPFTGEFNAFYSEGTYHCAGCNSPLFSSDSKFDAHCGWPSFDAALAKGNVEEKLDKSHGMLRTEILCGQCGGHLGHVFNDGPTESGLRYCVNSASLQFEKKKD